MRLIILLSITPHTTPQRKTLYKQKHPKTNKQTLIKFNLICSILCNSLFTLFTKQTNKQTNFAPLLKHRLNNFLLNGLALLKPTHRKSDKTRQSHTNVIANCNTEGKIRKSGWIRPTFLSLFINKKRENCRTGVTPHASH